MLLGGTDTDGLFQWSHQQLVKQLDLLVAVGGNYVRNVMSDRAIAAYQNNNRVHTRDNDVYAFKLIESGSNKGLYDLNQWNQEYWDRFTRMLDETAARNIIVQIELWDRHDFHITYPYGRGWAEHPWNPKNNINYTASNTILEESGKSEPGDLPFFRTVPALDNDPIVLAYQEKFIAKVMSTALKYDHVLYVTTNEASEPIEWSRHWSQFMKKRANEAGKTIYRSPMQDNVLATLDEVLRFPQHYEFIEANFGPHPISGEKAEQLKQRHANMLRDIWERFSLRPIPMNQIKASTGSWGFDEKLERAWRGVLSGTASMRFHRPDRGAGLSSKAQKHIAALRMFTDMLIPWTAQPHHQLTHLLSDREINEAYLMADPGQIYVLYMTHDADYPNPKADYKVTLNISAIEGSALVRWYNVENSTWSSQHEFTTSSNSVTLQRPSAAHWVAVIEKMDLPTPSVVVAPTISLSANPTNISYNGAATLSWSTTNATSCTASGSWSGSKSTSGSQSTGNLTSNKTYRLDCTGNGGATSRSVTVSVEAAPAPTISFSANPTSVSHNSASTLTWSSTNATSCTASGGWSGSKSTSGSQSTGNLTSNKTYRLDCTGNGGTTSCSVTVSVRAIPTYTLSASINSGSGTITASGINCPGDCSQSYTSGTWVTIVATPASGSTFTNWSSGSGSGCPGSIQPNKGYPMGVIIGVTNKYKKSIHLYY